MGVGLCEFESHLGHKKARLLKNSFAFFYFLFVMICAMVGCGLWCVGDCLIGVPAIVIMAKYHFMCPLF